jgi:hypothetical protein
MGAMCCSRASLAQGVCILPSETFRFFGAVPSRLRRTQTWPQRLLRGESIIHTMDTIQIVQAIDAEI